ncbi:low molecular weight phosphotyrosine protein phosphatase [Mumia sp. zg.B53]|uniref:low molecular weight protein-tyrosine-phosphatase n=1 Tax=unclassified Mumia TaxID=2621872 RepID=UPI001C6F527E|nr:MULTISPECIES: low molecular weight protein-tyrosine-phosphatase [unclassified Mumia]MBW9204323.1 low molecular weight phosphotyrosine protein phosphatase [Mumia sp. zg.B17]MBW9209692.1 low molecular weight phosphotyrosine protein phosphatase [Mumia sp. zg.B21]MBW9214296.1 low molecular weight phosphotyrosine protein phosphatase [Mumia sp. zg.B53]MDD9348015.1 low molecular weight phosphotyrosine protein phosphatase [Mumia sp.]
MTTGSGHPLRIALVCLGNICRSPMADVVLEKKLADAGLADEVHVDSAGTGDWHRGEPMDPRAAAILEEHGYDPTRHRAQQITSRWFDDHDLVLTMDGSNFDAVRALARTPRDRSKVQMFRSYDPVATPGDDEVPDPWYGGPSGFEHVLRLIERTSDAIVASAPRLVEELAR